MPLSSHFKLVGERLTGKRWMDSSLPGLVLMTHVQLNYCSNDAVTVMDHSCYYFISCVNNYTLRTDSLWLYRTWARFEYNKLYCTVYCIKNICLYSSLDFSIFYNDYQQKNVFCFSLNIAADKEMSDGNTSYYRDIHLFSHSSLWLRAVFKHCPQRASFNSLHFYYCSFSLSKATIAAIICQANTKK